jgi:hypothetical protein
MAELRVGRFRFTFGRDRLARCHNCGSPWVIRLSDDARRSWYACPRHLLEAPDRVLGRKDKH